MKRRISLTILATFLGTLVGLLAIRGASPVQAQIDAFTFYIPFPTDQLNKLFDLAHPQDFDFSGAKIITTISISIRRDDTLIYYDHWEDGLEDTVTNPGQSSTEVWGDGNPANGAPPGFSGDNLQAGDIITLQNEVDLPRNPADILYDGGDLFSAVGGSVAVTLATWPDTAIATDGVTIVSVTTLYAGAWELLPTGFWGTDYRIPVGVDLAGVRPAFGVVGVNVQAVADGTTVELDLDADGNFEQTITLNQGQQFTDTSGSVVSGARVHALNHPVQVHVFTGNPNVPDEIEYEARAYSMLPLELLANDYLIPRSSDGDFWLYNPHGTDLTVNAETSAGVDTITISPDSTARYPVSGLSGPTGVRFRSTDGRTFDGVVALDDAGFQDWGYPLMPVVYLTGQVLVGWAPGNSEQPPGPVPPNGTGFESRVYVTSLTDTTLTVIYDLATLRSETISLTALAEVEIVDRDDFDMTGAFLFTPDGTPFVAVWGQDQTATPREPSIDVGTGLIPLRTLSLQKTISLIDDADGSGTITWGDTVRFQILTENNSNLPLDPTVISDTLSSSVDYLANTSTIRGGSIPDDAVPPKQTIFPFDEGGALIPGGMAPQEVVIATFDAIVNENVDEIVNTAFTESPQVPRVPPVTIVVPVRVARYELAKRLTDPPTGIAKPGDLITFVKTITSTGNIDITVLPLRDVYDPDHLTFAGATPPPDLTAAGVLTWFNLADPALFGPLPPGRAIDISTSFQINQVPESVTNTINIALVEGATGIDGIVLPPATATAPVIIEHPTGITPTPTPAPTSTPTPKPTREPEREDTPTPLPPPAPTFTPTPALIAAVATPQFPTLLPETGARDPQAGAVIIGALLLLGIGLATRFWWTK